MVSTKTTNSKKTMSSPAAARKATQNKAINKKRPSRKAPSSKTVANNGNHVAIPEDFDIMHAPHPDTVTCVPAKERSEYATKYAYIQRFLAAYRLAFPDGPDKHLNAERFKEFLPWLLANPQKDMRFSYHRSMASSWARYKNGMAQIYANSKENEQRQRASFRMNNAPPQIENKKENEDEDEEMDMESPLTVKQFSSPPAVEKQVQPVIPPPPAPVPSVGISSTPGFFGTKEIEVIWILAFMKHSTRQDNCRSRVVSVAEAPRELPQRKTQNGFDDRVWLRPQTETSMEGSSRNHNPIG